MHGLEEEEEGEEVEAGITTETADGISMDGSGLTRRSQRLLSALLLITRRRDIRQLYTEDCRITMQMVIITGLILPVVT